MIEDGEAIPEPSSLDDLADDPDMKGAVAFLVTATVRDAIMRVNITARESQMEKIDALAKAAGMTRSAYMVQAASRAAARVEEKPRKGKPGPARAKAARMAS